MNDLTKEEFSLYKKWPQEEIFNGLMLQYDLLSAQQNIVSIPFRVIEWVSSSVNAEYWLEEHTKTYILLTGEIIFEGVRHCNFSEYDNGYVNYPNLKGLSLCLNRLHELCIQYSRDYL